MSVRHDEVECPMMTPNKPENLGLDMIPKIDNLGAAENGGILHIIKNRNQSNLWKPRNQSREDICTPRHSWNPKRKNCLKKGPTSQSLTMAAINSVFQIPVSYIDPIIHLLPCLIALVWALALYFAMPS